MVHELCHRRHMNHSQRYWRLVESFEPQWRTLDAELLQGLASRAGLGVPRRCSASMQRAAPAV